MSSACPCCPRGKRKGAGDRDDDLAAGSTPHEFRCPAVTPESSGRALAVGVASPAAGRTLTRTSL